MANIKTVEAGKYNLLLAEALRKEEEFKQPEWAEYVKSSAARERPVNDEDFWHKRAASILRQIYIREIVGVERLRTRYGGNKDRGQKPKRFVKGSGKIIRVILMQAEEAGLVEKTSGKKMGRKLTSKGREFLEKIAEPSSSNPRKQAQLASEIADGSGGKE